MSLNVLVLNVWNVFQGADTKVRPGEYDARERAEFSRASAAQSVEGVIDLTPQSGVWVEKDPRLKALRPQTRKRLGSSSGAMTYDSQGHTSQAPYEKGASIDILV